MSATIVVEDGTGKTDSNSYVSAADLATYMGDRGVTLVGTAEDLLINAMDYIESISYKGTKNSDAQALQWPRYGVSIDSYSVGSDELPQLLIDALCEVVIGIDGGVDPLANLGRSTKSEQVGTIKVEYEPGTRAQTSLQAADAKLKKLRKAGSSSVNAVVSRA